MKREVFRRRRVAERCVVQLVLVHNALPTGVDAFRGVGARAVKQFITSASSLAKARERAAIIISAAVLGGEDAVLALLLATRARQ